MFEKAADNPQTIRIGSTEILIGDALDSLRQLSSDSVHCCVTSPPYWGLRDYGVDGQIGLEASFQEFVDKLVAVFAEVRRVLRPDGTLWLNLGDCYTASGRGVDRTGSDLAKQHNRSPSFRRDRAAVGSVKHRRGLKPKDLVGIPWRVAFALQEDGWYLRQDIIWHKPNPMPETVADRCTKAHEYLFLLSKSGRYFYDKHAISEPAITAERSKSRSVNDKAKLPSGWDDGPGAHGSFHRNGRSSPKQNAKAANAYSGFVDRRNRRSVWRISTKGYPGAHFATFPPQLVEPCILAGTSSRGCCPECGAPLARRLDKTRVPTRPGVDSKVGRASKHPESPYGRQNGMVVGNRDPQRHVTRTTTVGWLPTCGHEFRHVTPCVVLDPFGGSGTTAAVATELGRRAVLCELNPAYAELAVERLKNVSALIFLEGEPTSDMRSDRKDSGA